MEACAVKGDDFSIYVPYAIPLRLTPYAFRNTEVRQNKMKIKLLKKIRQERKKPRNARR